MASYRLLAPIYVQDRYMEAGTIVTDQGGNANIPVGYVPPPLACEPLDDTAIAFYYAAGPRGVGGAEFGLTIQFGYAGGPGHFVGQQGGKPTIYWSRVISGPFIRYQLTGTNFPLI
jgi:hypothetical protein